MTTTSSAVATTVVNPVELIKQVIENIHAQLQPLEFEIGNASQGDSSYVKALFDSLHEMKSRAEQADMILAQVLADPNKLELAIARIEGPSDTYSKLTSLVAKVDELEQEITTAEYDYFTIVAELLLEVQEQMIPFEPFIATPQIRTVKSKVLTMETELKKKVQWSFREERFAQLQLIPYEKMFKIGTKYAGLEYLDQRFAWFKYLLSVVDSKRTKKHITDILTQTEKENPEANAHVAFVLKSLQSIKASFSVKGNSTLLEVKESMGDAFDPFLGPYVQREREELEKLMETVMRAEEESIRVVPTEGVPVPAPGEPFESSRKMFEYMKKSLFRCADFSTGITFLSLSKEFRVCLQQYSESLKFRCPNPDPRGEYCIDTIPAQEKLMKSKIQSQFLDEVDFSSQIDAFMDLVSHTMNVLASGEVFRLDGDFIAMRKVNWSALEEVGDVGPYAKHMFKILTDGVGRIRQALSPAYFQNMCTKLAAVFLDEFLDNIWQLRRDAVIAIKGGRGIILPINPAAIHKTITKGAATNAADIKTGLLKVGDNVKNEKDKSGGSATKPSRK
eukprot:gene28548-37506_t